MCALIDFLQTNVSFDTFFSAFLGFGSALIVEAIVTSISDRRLRKNLTEELKKELNKVKDVANKNANQEHMEFFLRPYIITVWKGACSSNSIICLNKSQNYKKIIEVFESIEDANEFEKECFYKFFSHDDNQAWETMKSMLCKNRKKIAEETNVLLELLE